MAAPPQNTTLSVAHHQQRRKNKSDHAAEHQANNNVRSSYKMPRCTGRRAARRVGHAPSTSRHATSTAGAGEGDRQADLPPPPPHIHKAAEPSDTGYSAERRRGTPRGAHIDAQSNAAPGLYIHVSAPRLSIAKSARMLFSS